MRRGVGILCTRIHVASNSYTVVRRTRNISLYINSTQHPGSVFRLFVLYLHTYSYAYCLLYRCRSLCI